MCPSVLGLSPAGGADTVYSIPEAFSDFALLVWLQTYCLVTVIFLSALLAPALFSLSQMILVNAVTGREKARLALGKAEQDVMELDWEAGFGMCSCIAQLTCCHPVQGHEQGARLWDGITRGCLVLFSYQVLPTEGYLWHLMSVAKLPTELDCKTPFKSPR